MKEFSIVRKGFNPDEVIEYVEYVEELEKVLKGYKEKDEAIKNAILSAQVAADNIVQNAKNEASELRRNAVFQLQEIKNSVALQKEMYNNFKLDYERVFNKYMKTFSQEESDAVIRKIDTLNDYITRLASGSSIELNTQNTQSSTTSPVYNKVVNQGQGSSPSQEAKNGASNL